VVSGRPPRRVTASPEKSKSGPVPADYRLRFHYQQDLGRSGPNAAQRRPEQPVQALNSGADGSLQDGDLLPQGQDFQGSVASTAEETRMAARRARMNLTTNL